MYISIDSLLHRLTKRNIPIIKKCVRDAGILPEYTLILDMDDSIRLATAINENVTNSTPPTKIADSTSMYLTMAVLNEMIVAKVEPFVNRMRSLGVPPSEYAIISNGSHLNGFVDYVCGSIDNCRIYKKFLSEYPGELLPDIHVVLRTTLWDLKDINHDIQPNLRNLPDFALESRITSMDGGIASISESGGHHPVVVQVGGNMEDVLSDYLSRIIHRYKLSRSIVHKKESKA